MDRQTIAERQKPTERITREGSLGTSRNLGFFPEKGLLGIYSTESLLFVPRHLIAKKNKGNI